jgi:DNA-binding HxlR family transcriptional regulator
MPDRKVLHSALGTPAATVDAAARRELARRDHIQQLRDCPGHLVIGLVSERWATLIIEALAEGPQRHSDLRRRIPGATQKMLTQTLRGLERNGLLTRSVEPTVPVRVDYALTKLGHEFFLLQRTIFEWALSHLEKIRSARAAFDLNPPYGPELSVPALNQRRPGRREPAGHPGAGGRVPGATVAS